MAEEQQFVGRVLSFRLKTQEQANRVVRALGLKVLEEVLRRAPVKTGRFRGNWRVSVGAVDLSTDDGPTSLGVRPQSTPSGLELGRALGPLAQVKVGDTLYVTNNLPYALGLERGRSKQAPQGVMRLGVDAVANEFAAVVAQVTRSST
jgi:hypothetical protein